MMKHKLSLLIAIPHLLFWVTYVALNLIIASQFMDISLMLRRVSFIVGFNLIVYCISYWYLVPVYFMRKRYPTFYGLSIGMLVLTMLLRWYLDPLFTERHAVKLDNEIVLISVLFISQAMIIFISSLIAIAKSMFTLEIKVNDLALQKKEADLNAIKARINPHFLLNTLNNIYSRSLTEHHQAANSVLELSRLLQFTLYDIDREQIPLRRELDALEALAGLYRLRWGAQLDIRFNFPDDDQCEQIELVPLMLFSLFENALKHSGMGQEKEAWISVEIETKPSQIVYTICNGLAKHQNTNDDDYHGLGLSSLRQLLETHYGDEHHLVLYEDESMYKATLSLAI